MAVANALVHYDVATMMTVKSFIVLAPGYLHPSLILSRIARSFPSLQILD
jgi:hypothetical protein